MPLTIRHPSDPTWTATVGSDDRGPWVEVQSGGVVLRHDDTEVDFDSEAPVRSVLRLLAEFGFLAGRDVDDALAWLDRPSCWRRRPPRRMRKVLRVVEELAGRR